MLTKMQVFFQKYSCDPSLQILLSLIKNNEAIPDFLEKILIDTSMQDKAETFYQAILQGDWNAEIFFDKEASYYLLYLIHTPRLKLPDTITSFFYVMVIQQFTSNFNTRPFTLHSLVQDSIGEEYLNQVAQHLSLVKDTKSEDIYKILKDFVLHLPPIEQWIFKISFYNLSDVSKGEYSTNFDMLMYQLNLSHTIPFIKKVEEKNQGFYLIPSYKIIQFCVEFVSKEFLNPVFLLGIPGQKTLESMHARNEHPILLPGANKTMLKVHGYKCGMVGVAIHDFSHLYWGGLLSKAFRAEIFNFLVPTLESLIPETEAVEDFRTAKLIKNYCIRLKDFDLLGSAQSPENIRIKLYLTHAFHHRKFIHYGGQTPLGEQQYDNFYYLVVRKQLLPNTWSSYQQELWDKLVEVTSELINHNRFDNNLISTVINRLAQITVLEKPPVFDCDKISISYNRWCHIFNNISDQKVLWEKSLEYHEELIKLILHHNLPFYMPYLPLKPEVKKQFSEEFGTNKATITQNFNVVFFQSYHRVFYSEDYVSSQRMKNS